jgi:DNA-binding NarL/FixJ family response regulator
MNKIRVLLADDHTVLRAGLKALLATQPDLDVVGETGHGNEAVRLAAGLRPDVLLLDVTMPGNEQFAALRGVRPVFTEEMLSDQELAAIIAYVRSLPAR